MTLDEIEARREARRQTYEAARSAQRAKDIEALDALEEAHGYGAVRVVEPARWVPGLPTLAVVRAPDPAQFKRWRDRLRGEAAKEGRGDLAKPTEELADVCIVYPDQETYARLREASPGLHLGAGNAAAALATGKEIEAGKS